MVNVPVDEVTALGLAADYPPANGETFFASYDSMYELAQALQTKEGDTVTRWGLSSKGFELESLAGIMASLGQRWWDPEAMTFHFDSPEGIEALELLVARPVALGIETELDQSATQAALAGKVALSRGDGGPSVVGADAGFAFELAGAPRLQEGVNPTLVGSGGWGFMAPVNAKDPELSTAFLRFVGTEEGQMAFAKIYGGLLNFAWAAFEDDTSRFEDPSETNPIFRARIPFTEMAKSTEYFGEGFGYYGECQTAAGTVASAVRQGQMSTADAAKDLQARVEAQYAQFQQDVAAAG
jgi:ABC-type glycerol-3-phosphate transport system substrate-binding protein